MTIPYVHLRVHTEYSMVDGLVRVKPLVKRIAKLGMPAVAVTDQSNLFSLVKFYKAAMAEGVKPIAGADVWLYNPTDPAQPHRLTLLVQNGEGYKALTELISRSYQENQHQGVPMLMPEWLESRNQGLIALSGGREGVIGRALLAGNKDEARHQLELSLKLFEDRFYLELQRTGRPREEDYIVQALELAVEFQAPPVATNDVRFITPEEFEAHEARVCIHQGRVLDDPRRPRDYSDRQYLRSAEEMAELFADIPEALENTVEIAKRCNIELTLGKNFLPEFPVPEGMSPGDYFAEQSRAGLEERLAVLMPGAPAEKLQPYRERLEIEIGVIRQMDFPGYFLIVADFIQWAKKQGIPVGPGRGSGAGSLVAYALKITDLDPIAFDLLFERFLNPERVSMPDFDVDFCMERRDEVIDYVARHYGRDRVSQIITYGSMAAKAVVRDVGRVLGHGYGFVDRIAKLIPFELGITLDKALTDSEDLRKLYESDEEVKALIDLGKTLEGITRNAGKHAGGVVIAPSRLIDFSPLYCEQGGDNLVTQFDKDDVEAVGLVKFDFLGLRTLTIIDWAMQTLNRRRAEQGEAPLDINLIPRDDPASYALLKRKATTAVFQLESRGMKELIGRLLPDCFEDIIALVALFRPGPLQSGMVDDFVNRKHGKAKVEYPHPRLEGILKPTYGVIVYQEQVMQIAQVLAGYSLGGADLLRRAMGKKKPEEMAKQREIFVKGATEQEVEEKTAAYIFDLMEKFAEYGFNKSHSAAYALVSYQTAWLKAHYPAAFMAAVLSADMDNTDKVVVLIEECRDMKLGLVPPDVNHSEFRFTVRDDGAIVYGLGAIKGVGENAIEDIIRERGEHGPYADLFDLCRRIDLRKANRRVLEALIRAGALDGFDPNRARHMAQLSDALKAAEQHGAMEETGQDDLFGLMAEPASTSPAPIPQEAVEPWPEDLRLSHEKATLGLYLTGHPIAQYESELGHFVTGRIGKLSVESDGRSWGRSNEVRAVVAGLVVDLRTKQNKNGKRMGFVTLDDRTGRLEVAVFSEVFEQYREHLNKDVLLVAEGNLGMDDYAGVMRLTAEHLYSIEQARARYARQLLIQWPAPEEAPPVDELQTLIQPFQGGSCPIVIEYRNRHAASRLQLGERWSAKPSDELLNRLRKRLGTERVSLVYP
ncbi:DNA polymerase III subunit alpha [Methylococcus sp. EFPC2]|uniref:DNA polymerase III subunit alpha n=1 Tax=Methylococcus sp. EFPC2 TaxID=2812648 RepID=UPI001967676B|nr:DNA polymerase III subunit alpha [Methylococcus sp. EFPC2]QSA98474.1 DNA polymerase III subunit alpha [Methylococcus sp. EFPC2]